MDHLDEQTVAQLRQRLEEELATLRSKETDLTRDGADFEPSGGDRQDSAATETLRRQQLVLSGHERRRMAQVRAALGRMESGLYGICEESGEPIPAGRLKLEPTARFTVEVQAQLEAEGRGTDDPDDPDGPY